jgi:hypothetical protein
LSWQCFLTLLCHLAEKRHGYTRWAPNIRQSAFSVICNRYVSRGRVCQGDVRP